MHYGHFFSFPLSSPFPQVHELSSSAASLLLSSPVIDSTTFYHLNLQIDRSMFPNSLMQIDRLKQVHVPASADKHQRHRDFLQMLMRCYSTAGIPMKVRTLSKVYKELLDMHELLQPLTELKSNIKVLRNSCSSSETEGISLSGSVLVSPFQVM